MFLKKTFERNKNLFYVAHEMHKKGLILPNTYVIDLDSIYYNAQILLKKATKYGITLYQMTKQFGRNPIIAKKIRKAGIEKIVCVDFAEALMFIKRGFQIGNVGHLVQTPNSILKRVLKAKPDVITIFSYEKAKILNKCAQSIGLKQDIIIKVWNSSNIIYNGQEGGININDLENELQKIKCLDNVNIIGFTSFPAFIYENKKNEFTNNLKTINKATKIANKIGIKSSHINVPSSNCVSLMKKIKELGGTHSEPGHALMGTIPSNAETNEPEIPSLIYVSEISHSSKNKTYIYGGGYYPRGKMANAVVFSNNETTNVKMNAFDANYIDYYLNFDTPEKSNFKIGDTVLLAFRTQIFVTRANVVVVKGISKNNPKIIGTFSSQGERIKWL